MTIVSKRVSQSYHHGKVYMIAILLQEKNHNYCHNSIRYRIGLLCRRGILFYYYLNVHLFSGFVDKECVWWMRKVVISSSGIIIVGGLVMIVLTFLYNIC